MSPTGHITPRKQPKQVRAQATWEAILEATAQVLVEEGYDAATTNRIAEVAGVSIGSLYQYFPNKKALVAALIDRHEQRMFEQLDRFAAELPDAPLEEAVPAYVRAMLAVHAQNPRLYQVLIEATASVYDFNKLRQLQGRAEVVVVRYLERHRARLRPLDLEQAAFILVTAVDAVTHLAVLDRPAVLESEQFVDEVVELVLRYIVRDRGAPRPARRADER